MNENFGKNFIPQKRIDLAQAGLKVHNTVDTLSAISVLIFSTVCFIAIGIFASSFYVDYQIKKLGENISVLTSTFDEKEVTALVSLSGKVTAVKSVIDSQTYMTSIKNFLKDNTVQRVQLESFVFNEAGEKGAPRTLTVEGYALSYNTLANQSQIFKSNMYLSNVVFDNIAPTDDGTISFKATMTVKNDAFSTKGSTQ